MKNSIRLPGGVIVPPYGDGSVYFREVAPYWEAKAHQLGPSQIEITAKRPYIYTEGTEEDLTRDQRRMLQSIREGVNLLTEEEEEERRQRSLKIAANRAKTRVRKLCKTMQADTLLTLTYRANQTDLELCKKHLRAFVRRCRVFWPGFSAVAAFELQKRGAWHVHMAMASVPVSFNVRGENGALSVVRSFNLIRDQWRRVVGDLGGTINVARRKRASRKSPAQIAAYISKYIVKAFAEGEAYSNRYTRFGGEAPPPPVHLGRYRDACDMLADLYGLVGQHDTIASAVFSPFGDWFFLAAESPHVRKKAA